MNFVIFGIMYVCYSSQVFHEVDMFTQGDTFIPNSSVRIDHV